MSHHRLLQKTHLGPCPELEPCGKIRVSVILDKRRREVRASDHDGDGDEDDDDDVIITIPSLLVTRYVVCVVWSCLIQREHGL